MLHILQMLRYLWTLKTDMKLDQNTTYLWKVVLDLLTMTYFVRLNVHCESIYMKTKHNSTIHTRIRYLPIYVSELASQIGNYTCDQYLFFFALSI